MTSRYPAPAESKEIPRWLPYLLVLFAAGWFYVGLKAIDLALTAWRATW